MHRVRVGIVAGLALGVVAAAIGVGAGCGGSEPGRDLILATTTSTQDSGLLDVLVPLFEERSGLRVKTLAVGTGEALAMGSRGEADVLLTHAPDLEQALLDSGAATNRRLVMHNDFVIAGPAGDPAGVRGTPRAADALLRIVAEGETFVSRGDRSGTHHRERSLWREAGREPPGEGYVETGQGMAATLLVASARGGYVLTDRGTHLALRARSELVPLVEGDGLLLNVYSVLEVSPERFPGVNHAGARAFADFLVGDEAQAVVTGFGVERFGQPLFFPRAAGADAEGR